MDATENVNLAAVSKEFRAHMLPLIYSTETFATCVRNTSEGNELGCLELARSVKYPLKCVDFCKLRHNAEECERNDGKNPKQEFHRGYCSDVELKLDYPVERVDGQILSSDVKFKMLLFAQGNRQMRLTINRHPTPLLSSDANFLKFLKETSSYNPLACVEFPCYYTEYFGMGGSGYEHQFQSADFIS